MIPSDEPRAFLTPGWALGLTLFAAFLQGTIAALLFDWAGDPAASLFALSALVAFGLAFALGAARVPAPPGPHLGFRGAPAQAWLAVPFLLAAALIASEVDNLYKLLIPPPPEAGEAAPPSDVDRLLEWLLVFALVLPVIEEIYYRGLILPGLTRAWGKLGGVGFMALLNGMAASIVIGGSALAYVASIALVLGVLRICSGSILPGLLLNVALGLLGVLAARDFFGIPGFDDTSAPHTPLAYLVPAALSVGIGLRLCRAAEHWVTPVEIEVEESEPDSSR
jgi:membrane protease YdiL (CAAX protease family)